MIDKLKGLWSRLRVRWHVLLLALAAASPSILQWLSGVDLRPVLTYFLSDHTADLIMAVLPFGLMFLKSAVHLDEPEEE